MNSAAVVQRLPLHGKVENCGRHQWRGAHGLTSFGAVRFPGLAGGTYVRNGSGNPSRFKRVSVVPLFKCAVKDDVLVDAIVEKLYGTMKDFDAPRAKQAVELIVDRHTTTASKLRALLEI